MSVVFADSFHFIALSNPDGHHAAAVRAAESLTSRLLTTHYVLIEVADALSAPRFRADGRPVPPSARSGSRHRDHRPRHSPLRTRPRPLRPASRQGLVPTDCISFVVMTERGLTEALTGDNHFEQAGFHALLR